MAAQYKLMPDAHVNDDDDDVDRGYKERDVGKRWDGSSL